MSKFNVGDRVVVKDTLLFNDRVGTLVPTSGEPDDPWDWCVELDALGNSHVSIFSARKIGVSEYQIDLEKDKEVKI
jgi:hypothetical protein